MQLDIRLPIGLMFAVVGGLLAVFGLIGDKSVSQPSLGINVNLWWGLVMLIFGIVMFLLGPIDGQYFCSDYLNLLSPTATIKRCASAAPSATPSRCRAARRSRPECD